MKKMILPGGQAVFLQKYLSGDRILLNNSKVVGDVGLTAASIIEAVSIIAANTVGSDDSQQPATLL